MGVCLLHILQQAVLGSPNTASSHNGSVSEQNSSIELSISASYRYRKFIIFASGIPYSVAKVKELLAWLIASLRSSPSNQGAVSLSLWYPSYYKTAYKPTKYPRIKLE
jgi:hypothetical protein